MRRSWRHHEERQETPDSAPLPVRRVESDPVRRLAELQRLAGNQAVVAASQAASSLHVGHADDAAEHAADRAADRALERLEAAPEPGAVQRSASAAPGAEVGREGGPIQPETTARIEAARSSGRALEPDVRRSMESAFDADFSGVRIHADNQAAELNQRLSARAFTTGRDVFFGKGEYAPGTSSGQRVLAHELAHTLQQGSGSVGRVHRLTFQNTQWSGAKTAKVSAGGGIGVLIIDDGSGPLVVKAGEAMAPEAAVAAKLLTEASGGGGTGWSASAPEARPVDPAEALQIHASATPLLGTTKREKNLMGDLAAGKGVMVFGFAKGKELQESLEESQTKKGLLGGSLRKDSASYALMNDPGLLRTIGRGSASDVILGNADRLVGSINFENVMLDLNAKSISFIDNVQMKMETFLRDSKDDRMTGKESFDAWVQHERTKKLAARDFKGIATDAMNAIGDKLLQTVSAEDKKVVQSSLKSKKSKMITWFATGLQEGHKNCLTALSNGVKMVSTLPADMQQEVATNILARRNVVQGMAAKAAWDAAEVEAEKLFAPTPAPSTATAPQPQQQAPWKKATPQGKWKPAQPKGRWKPATPSSWG